MAQSASGLGPKMRNQGVGVPVPHIVLGFQDGDHCHMFLIRHACQNRQPVVDGFAIDLFDGWNVGRGPFYRVVSSHHVISLFACHGYSHRTNGMATFRHCCKLFVPFPPRSINDACLEQRQMCVRTEDVRRNAGYCVRIKPGMD